MTRGWPWWVLLAACNQLDPIDTSDPDPGTDPDTDTETDPDTDTETDTDPDTDTETDTDTDTDTAAPPDPLTRWTTSGKTDADGLFEVEFDVGADQEAFMSELVVGSSYLASLEEIRGPSGGVIVSWEDWYDADESLTYAWFPSDVRTTVNWPVRKEDGPLSPGTYTVVWAPVDGDGNYVSGVSTKTINWMKTDKNLNSGTVNVVIVYAKNVDSDPDVVDAVEAAVEIWRDTWSAAGITLNERYESSTIPAALPYPSGSATALTEAGAFAGDREVVVLIGRLIAADTTILGYSGGIPGSLEPSGLGGVEVSWLASAGTDGAFNADEVEMLGGTMAHEILHYLGLFHPVEDGWQYYDALADTVRCASQVQCESKLGSNLMYPYAICDGTGCLEQLDLTADQGEVAQRWTGTE